MNNAVNEKNSVNKSSGKEISKGKLMIILGLLPSFILALIVVGFFIMLLVQGENLTNPSLFESALNIAEADMISTAITIWVGLNIYNLTTKEELEDKIDERISKHLDSVKKKKNAQTLENEIHKNAFIKELEKIGIDMLYRILY